MSAICAAGPPKDKKPIRAQTPSAVEKLGAPDSCATSCFSMPASSHQCACTIGIVRAQSRICDLPSRHCTSALQKKL